MADDERSELGEGTGKHGPWEKEEEGPRAAKQEGDPHALDVAGDPRGGVQADDYRHAEAREIVTEGEVAMSGPAGAPQEERSLEERRRLGDKRRRGIEHDDPTARQ